MVPPGGGKDSLLADSRRHVGLCIRLVLLLAAQAKHLALPHGRIGERGALLEGVWRVLVNGEDVGLDLAVPGAGTEGWGPP